MLLKACYVCIEPSSLLYFNVSDEVVCEQYLESKKFELQVPIPEEILSSRSLWVF